MAKKQKKLDADSVVWIVPMGYSLRGIADPDPIALPSDLADTWKWFASQYRDLSYSRAERLRGIASDTADYMCRCYEPGVLHSGLDDPQGQLLDLVRDTAKLGELQNILEQMETKSVETATDPVDVIDLRPHPRDKDRKWMHELHATVSARVSRVGLYTETKTVDVRVDTDRLYGSTEEFQDYISTQVAHLEVQGWSLFNLGSCNNHRIKRDHKSGETWYNVTFHRYREPRRYEKESENE